MIFCVPVRNLHLIDMEDFYQKNFQKILKKKNFGFFFFKEKRRVCSYVQVQSYSRVSELIEETRLLETLE